jgi:hypothetical protein
MMCSGEIVSGKLFFAVKRGKGLLRRKDGLWISAFYTS